MEYIIREYKIVIDIKNRLFYNLNIGKFRTVKGL